MEKDKRYYRAELAERRYATVYVEAEDAYDAENAAWSLVEEKDFGEDGDGEAFCIKEADEEEYLKSTGEESECLAP